MFIRFAMAAILAATVIGAQSTLRAQSSVNSFAQPQSVTVFQNGAEVNNIIKVNIPAGSSEIIISNVAHGIDATTIQVGVPEYVTILSVTKKQKDEQFVPSLPGHVLLKDSLDASDQRLQEHSVQLSAVQNALRLLQNDKILSGDATVKVSELSQLVDYYRNKTVELQRELNQYNKLLAEEKKINDRLKKAYQMLSGSLENIVLNINSTRSSAVTLSLSYMTAQANWVPYYDLRADNTSSPVSFVYKARIIQNSGVDWKNVRLSLSSGNPNQSGNAPVLTAMYARYQSSQQPAGQSNQFKKNSYSADNAVPAEMVPAPTSSASLSSGPRTTVQQNVLHTVFDIEVPYDILSNGLPHSVNLKEFKQAADFKYYAVPRLDKDIFLLAQLTGFSSLNLLPGEANVIFENQYVGKSYINPAVTSDTLSLSMGRDKAISVTRERITDKSASSMLGNNKRDIYEYEIRIRNNKNQPVNLHLKDQYPLSSDNSIEIDLTSDGGADVRKESGILNWQLDLKPGETKTIRFRFTVKYPKGTSVVFH